MRRRFVVMTLLAVLVVSGVVFLRRSSMHASAPNVQHAPHYTHGPDQQVLADLKLVQFKTYSALGATAVTASIRNDGTKDVKDVEVTCNYVTSSNEKIGGGRQWTEQRIAPQQTVTIKGIALGALPLKASRVDCFVSNFVVL